MGDHRHNGEDSEKFSMRAYLRVMKYTRKYWKRLTIGLLSGFLVGGSLLAGLLLLPNMVEAVNPSGTHEVKISAGAARILDAVEDRKSVV